MAIKVIFFDLGETLVTKPRKWLPGAKVLLQSLRQKGFRLGIISNTEGLTTRAEILKLLPVDFDLAVFDEDMMLFSSEVGKAKPQKEIFEEAVGRAHQLASQCLFCSEDIVDTLMAQHVGMRSIRVQVAPNNDLDILEEEILKFQALT